MVTADRRSSWVRKVNPSLQTTRVSPIFDDVAVAAALKASRTISVIGEMTFPSSIVNSKACAFLKFWTICDGGGSPKLRDSFSSDMVMVAVAVVVIGDLGSGFD
ncbi:hypothetical protein TIFTF001_027328 [Ficus carica]|uniref:Uncharacterized protein n=1 Tax=Ficus carica TaxID=3494 RepID=A0AA88IZG4_FICCA|nr:hypothetical protein TIFTF001_027328 [Ficus carica]